MIVRELFAKLGLATDKKSFSAADRMLSTVKKALVGIVAYKSVRWFAGLINDTRAAADQFNKMAQQVGIASESLQQLEYAAQIGGTDLGVLRTGLQRFARNANDVTRGVKEASDGFKMLGMSVTDSGGQLRSLDDLLMESADRFAAMPEGPRKTAASMMIFGRAGAQLLPMLNQGSKGISELRQEFVDLGAQIDTETGAQFEGLNDDMHRVKTMFVGIRNQAVIALLPVLKDLAKSMIAWMKANKEVLRQRLATVFHGLVTVLRTLGKVLGFVIDHWKELAIVVGSAYMAAGIMKIVTALKLMGAVSMATGLKAAAAWAIGMWPLVLLGAAIAAAILIVEDLWHAFTGGESVFKDLHAWAVDWGVKAFEKIEAIFRKARAAWDAFMDWWSGDDTQKGLVGRVEQVGREEFITGPERQRRYESQRQTGLTRARMKALIATVNPSYSTATAPLASSRSVQQNVHASVTINAQTGASAEDIGAEARKAIEAMTFGQYRAANAAIGGD